MLKIGADVQTDVAVRQSRPRPNGGSAIYSPGPATDVLTCAIDQGFAGATLSAGAGPPNQPPTLLLFGAAEIELNAASIVLTFAKKNGFPAAQYFGGTLVTVPSVYGGTSSAVENPTGITLPPPSVVFA